MSGGTVIEKFKRLGHVLAYGTEPSVEAVTTAAEELLAVAMQTVPVVSVNGNGHHIGSLLQSAFDDVVAEAVPDKFTKLIAEIDAPKRAKRAPH